MRTYSHSRIPFSRPPLKSLSPKQRPVTACRETDRQTSSAFMTLQLCPFHFRYCGSRETTCTVPPLLYLFLSFSPCFLQSPSRLRLWHQQNNTAPFAPVKLPEGVLSDRILPQLKETQNHVFSNCYIHCPEKRQVSLPLTEVASLGMLGSSAAASHLQPLSW